MMVAKIDFTTGDFSSAERDLPWEQGVGASGGALEENDFAWWDRHKYPQAAGEMSPIHVELTKDLQSELAAPIYRPGAHRHPVGILGMDSRQPIESTRF